MNFSEALQDGQGTLAWLTAVMLALGATAVVVAAWLQIRRGVSAKTVLKAVLGLKVRNLREQTRAAAARPQGDTGPGVPELAVEQEAAPRAVRAYEAVVGAPAPRTDDDASPMLTERQLNVYLERLRKAADTLEKVARTSTGTADPTRDEPTLQEI